MPASGRPVRPRPAPRRPPRRDSGTPAPAYLPRPRRPGRSTRRSGTAQPWRRDQHGVRAGLDHRLGTRRRLSPPVAGAPGQHRHARAGRRTAATRSARSVSDSAAASPVLPATTTARMPARDQPGGVRRGLLDQQRAVVVEQRHHGHRRAGPDCISHIHHPAPRAGDRRIRFRAVPYHRPGARNPLRRRRRVVPWSWPGAAVGRRDAPPRSSGCRPDPARPPRPPVREPSTAPSASPTPTKKAVARTLPKPGNPAGKADVPADAKAERHQ